jgi:protein-S-isoprenylcysteine O-methyltransferase Ste14
MKIQTFLLTVVPTAFLAFLVARYRPEHPGAVQITGLVLAVIGIVLWIAARMQLGNSFSVRPRAKALVTSGIYARIRNPIYVFSTLALTGLALYCGKAGLLLLLAILIPMQIARARAEAAVLRKRFGEEYVRYRAGTWF